MNRCADAYPDSTHFYLKDERCACAKPYDCSNGINGNASSANKKYQRYTINRGMQQNFHQASICLSPSVGSAPLSRPYVNKDHLIPILVQKDRACEWEGSFSGTEYDWLGAGGIGLKMEKPP